MRDEERKVQLFFAGSGQTRVGPNQGPLLPRLRIILSMDIRHRALRDGVSGCS